MNESVVVPVEPTEEMVSAAYYAFERVLSREFIKQGLYKAIAAAPTPEQSRSVYPPMGGDWARPYYDDEPTSEQSEVERLRQRVEELKGTLSNEECDSAFWQKRAEAAEAKVAELEADNRRLKQDKFDALNVKSRDGLLSSEWIARTGAAERLAEAAEAKVAELKSLRKATIKLWHEEQSRRQEAEAKLEAVWGLVEKWRTKTVGSPFGLAGIAGTRQGMEKCANELEALLKGDKS